MATAMGVAALLAAIVESSDDAIVARDLNGVIESWNPAAERLFGYAAADALDQPITRIIPDERHHEEAFVQQRLREGTSLERLETTRRRKDGRDVNVLVTVAPIKAADGSIVGALEIVRDLTKERRAADRLAEEVRIVETLNRVGAVVAATLDHDEVVQAVTEAACELTTAAVAAFVSPRDNDTDMPLAVHAMSGSADPSFPGALAAELVRSTLRADGVLRLADVSTDPAFAPSTTAAPVPPIRSYLAVPVVKASGEARGVLVFGHSDPGVFTDRHELLARGIAGWTAVALENARLYQEAQEANRIKDEFLATLSHELRTPLNAIMGWSQILGSGSADERSRTRALEVIQRNARALAQLIDDLLDVSRIVAGKLTLRHDPVQLTSVIAAAIDDIKPAAVGKSIDLRSTLDVAASAVLGDAARLQQIVWNLLSNAVKFTPPGGRVTVSLERQDGHARLSVADTGRGIARPFLEHVFDPFRQADSSPARQQGGLGLGLGIVKHLTEAHGGTVFASSPGEGAGSTFEVRLPLRADRPPAEGRRDGSAEPPAPGQLSGVRILVVDDDRDSADMLALTLVRYGADVIAVSSARDALQLATERPFDVLLADIAMPEMNGYDLVRAVRALEAEQRISLITAGAVTAYAGRRERRDMLAAGFDWHVPKPIDPEQVVARVSVALKTRRDAASRSRTTAAERRGRSA
jgi:PAS domain S-box-containing protein